MGRKPAIIGLVVLALLLASGTGAAQSVTSSIDTQGSSNVEHHVDHTSEASARLDADAFGEPIEVPCPPGQACTQAVSEGGSGLDASLDLAGELSLHLDVLDELVAPSGPPADEDEPATVNDPSAPEQESPAPVEHYEEIVTYTNGGGSIDANASGTASVSYDTEGEPLDPPRVSKDEAPDEEPPAETPVRTEDRLTATVDAFVDASPIEEVDHEANLSPEADLPVEQSIDVGNDGSFRLSLRGALRATTDGITSAFDGVTSAVEGLVNSVRGALSTETSANVSSTVEVVDAVAPVDISIDAVAGLTGNAEQLATTEAPLVEVPAVDVSSETDLRSETRVSTGLTGDLGLGL